ncbi:MAG: TrpR, YerC/YecD [Candidatus Harrisonbacteria bacterium CG10_big_fil_rev_8_21_14_0_10_49_15]|uniref:TrpR, YerC/YecD n=1 Tax=Candidatus Harrisonbacteria bacterium CG10_big_fil_rev_8_21_14_0_10_49_15 TaxID=1974587 RepID=A0A2H0UJT9_9BACT|nr:MAG: TrpR, YerC/YecD [Candidatus Harrisonbacteria bacterium CG10_big_fil_rev_8_21_14_0_10_49_15]
MDWNTKQTTELIDALLALKDRGQARRFLRDLMTEKELVELGSRWAAARMLAKKVPYTEITKQTGLSSRTVARISQWLNKGMGGYRALINASDHTHINPLPGSGLR